MLKLIAGLVLAIGIAEPCQAARRPVDSDTDIFGDWRVVAALDSADVTSIDDIQARKLVGKTVRITKKSFEFNGQVCRAPTYARTRQLTETYFLNEMRASPENLGLPRTVTVIDARCTYLYPKSKGKLMFFWDGFFFDATRMAPPRTAASK